MKTIKEVVSEIDEDFQTRTHKLLTKQEWKIIRARLIYNNNLQTEIGNIADEIEHGYCSPCPDGKLIKNGISRLRLLLSRGKK